MPYLKKLKKKKLKTISQLKKEADRKMSLLVRARDGGCVTCGSKENLQNGHYVPRNWMALRYDERNNNCQCLVCNVFKKGNMDEYARFLIRKYGTGILEELNKLKKPTQFKRKDFENIIKIYS